MAISGIHNDAIWVGESRYDVLIERSIGADLDNRSIVLCHVEVAPYSRQP